MGNHKFELAISILVHENCEFVNLQIMNIRQFYPNSIVVIHASEFFFKYNKSEILKIAERYNVIINPNHFKTGWGTPSIFKAMISNQLILNEYPDWTHFIFISSNELFYINKFEEVFNFQSQDFEIPKIYQLKENLYQFEIKDEKLFNARESDINYLQILLDFQLNNVIIGSDYGRLMNRKAFSLLQDQIQKYNFYHDDLDQTKHYTQSEIVIPTLIYVLELNNHLIVEKNIRFVYWPSEYESAKNSKDVILFKHVFRNIHNPFVKKIMKDNGIIYKTNLLQYFNSLFPVTRRKISNNLNKYL